MLNYWKVASEAGYLTQKPPVDKRLNKVDNLFVYRQFRGKNCGKVFDKFIGIIFLISQL
jgi:hypothetical protein